jgi:UDP-glucose:(heptosyl)LPS alpha-1,3-glucosyltransferase
MSRSNRLKIALVVHDFHRNGGHSRYTVELADRFKKDHDVHVFANRADSAASDGIACHQVPAVRVSALSTVLSFILPGTLLVRGRFDVIHAQGLCGFRHTIATAHICLAGWYEALIRSGTHLSASQRMFRALVPPLERKALAQHATRRVIAVSNRVRQDVHFHYGRADGVEVIHHGVDTDRFHPANRERFRMSVRENLGLGKNDFVALYVGDLKKGATPAIEAVAQTPGAKLLIVSASDFASYQTVAEARGVVDRVVFHSATSEIERFYAAADVFLFPTIYDSFGMVVTEAMASGLPVITSRAAGVAELIAPGSNGLLTDTPWDVDQLAGHLARLRDDSALRSGIAAAARTTVEPLTWDRVAERTMEVYLESLVESR